MITRRSVVLAGSAITTIAASLLTQWFLLTHLGATRELDAYFAALSVPIMMIYVLGDPLFRVAVPALCVRHGEDFHATAWMFFRIIGALFLVSALCLGVSARWWVLLLTPGFTIEDQRVVVSLVHIFLVGMVLQGLSGAARAVWSARNRFEFPALLSASAALLALACLAMAVPRYGILGAAWAFNVRFLIECVALSPILGRYVASSARHPTARSLMKDAQPLMLGAAYARTDVLVDRVLASMASPGSLSLLYLAQQILAAIGQILNQTFIAPLSPYLATLAHSGKWTELRQSLRTTAIRLSILVVVVAVLIPVAGEPVLLAIFRHKNMSPEGVRRLIQLMAALTGLLLGDSLAYLINTSFYALGNTRTPALATGIVYSVLVPAKVGAFFFMGIIGLALSTSAYYVINAAILVILFSTWLRRITIHRASAGALSPMAPMTHRSELLP